MLIILTATQIATLALAQLFGMQVLFTVMAVLLSVQFLIIGGITTLGGVKVHSVPEEAKNEVLEEFFINSKNDERRQTMESLFADGITSKKMLPLYTFHLIFSYWMWMSGLPAVAGCSLFCLFGLVFLIDKLSNIYQNRISLNSSKNEGQ